MKTLPLRLSIISLEFFYILGGTIFSKSYFGELIISSCFNHFKIKILVMWWLATSNEVSFLELLGLYS
jgi:hypothetical protein